MRIVRDDLKYLLFSEIYVKFGEPGARRRALGIVEAAIQCLARRGFGRVTVAMVAREAGVSRALVAYYFRSVEDVQDCAVKYIRLIYQRTVVDALGAKNSPREMLLAHVRACLEWTLHMRSHAIVWISYLHLCGRDSRRRKLNTLAVAVGTERLEALVRLGVEHGSFGPQDTKMAARSIQILITGAVISMCSETIDDSKGFINHIQSACLQLAGSA